MKALSCGIIKPKYVNLDKYVESTVNLGDSQSLAEIFNIEDPNYFLRWSWVVFEREFFQFRKFVSTEIEIE